MNWKEITLYTVPECIDTICGVLIGAGADGAQVCDPADFEEFMAGEGAYWDYVDEELEKELRGKTFVRFYLPENDQGAAILGQIVSELKQLAENSPLDFGKLRMETATVNEEDWANAWKEFYHPVQVGERLVICPSWEDYDQKEGQIVLRLDPGMAFGTGTHQTTRLCLSKLEGQIKGGERLMDMGCGSGILSIAALLLGAKEAVGVDIDELAVSIAGENAAQNGIGPDRLQLFCGNALSDRAFADSLGEACFDVVAANIVADVIIGMAPLLCKLLVPGGTLISSGIIEPRRAEVEAALAATGLTKLDRASENDWNCIIYRKNG